MIVWIALAYLAIGLSSPSSDLAGPTPASPVEPDPAEPTIEKEEPTTKTENLEPPDQPFQSTAQFEPADSKGSNARLDNSHDRSLL